MTAARPWSRKTVHGMTIFQKAKIERETQAADGEGTDSGTDTDSDSDSDSDNDSDDEDDGTRIRESSAKVFSATQYVDIAAHDRIGSTDRDPISIPCFFWTSGMVSAFPPQLSVAFPLGEKYLLS